MKMAKASKDDIQRCIKFFQLVEEYMQYGTHTPENDDTEDESIELTDEEDESIELTDEDFIERLRELWGGRFKPAGVDCAWARVVFGCDILIDNICDPDADTLELNPELEKALAEPDGIDEALAMLNGNPDKFRPILLDKNKILACVCDHAEKIAKKQRVEPWAVISDITHHGSGVSSAIYELYRRKPAPASCQPKQPNIVNSGSGKIQGG